MGLSLVASLLIAGVAYGMRYWAERAQTDRSAIVGLYLIHGIVSSLLTVAGLALAVYGRSGGWVMLAVGLGIGLPLFRPVRSFVARFTPLDPESPIDASGLSIVTGFIALLFGLSVLAPDPDEVESSVDYGLLAAQALLFVAISLACVGFGFRRTAKQTLERLGIVPLTPRPLAMVLVFVLLSFVVSSIGSALTAVLQPDFSEDIQEGLNELTSEVRNPVGALVLGVSAGVGEELLFRGALQPRFGIVITSFLFALAHSNYGLSFVMLGVFLMGMLLGYQRQRYGTTYAIITHAVFNFLVVLIQASA